MSPYRPPNKITRKLKDGRNMHIGINPKTGIWMDYVRREPSYQAKGGHLIPVQFEKPKKGRYEVSAPDRFYAEAWIHTGRGDGRDELEFRLRKESNMVGPEFRVRGLVRNGKVEEIRYNRGGEGRHPIEDVIGPEELYGHLSRAFLKNVSVRKLDGYYSDYAEEIGGAVKRLRKAHRIK